MVEFFALLAATIMFSMCMTTFMWLSIMKTKWFIKKMAKYTEEVSQGILEEITKDLEKERMETSTYVGGVDPKI